MPVDTDKSSTSRCPERTWWLHETSKVWWHVSRGGRSFASSWTCQQRKIKGKHGHENGRSLVSLVSTVREIVSDPTVCSSLWDPEVVPWGTGTDLSRDLTLTAFAARRYLIGWAALVSTSKLLLVAFKIEEEALQGLWMGRHADVQDNYWWVQICSVESFPECSQNLTILQKQDRLSLFYSTQPNWNALPMQEVLEKETTYKHAGMIQLTTQGQMAFLHHTADSKWDPRQDFAYFGYPISYVTYPLNPVQAAKVFLDGWLWPDKFVIKDVNACPAEPGLNLWSTIERCHLVDQEQDEAKIAIIPVAEFPELLHAVYEGLRIFQDWQFSFFKNTNPLSSMFENL